MKVAILAAGIGSRLHPETFDRPKAMIRINNKPLVQYQVESILEAGFKYEDINIVGGFMMEQIQQYFEGTGVQFIYNPYYDSMNNIYSFLLTRQIGDDLLLMNSDVFYDKRLIPLILNTVHPTCILVDKQIQLTEESMRVSLDCDRLKAINKKIDYTFSDGEFIGISKLANKDLAIFYHKAHEMIVAGATNAWYENVFEACSSEVEIIAVATERYPWIEIDDSADLAMARQLSSIIV